MRYVLFLILILQGCSLKPNMENSATIQKYIIKKPSLNENSVKIDKTIKVALPVAPSYMFTKQIVYTTKDGLHDAYVYNLWDENLVSQIQFLMAFTLNKAYKNVILSPSSANYELSFESRIETFEFNESREEVDLLVRVFLLDKNRNIIKSKSFHEVKKVHEVNPKGVVKGFSEVYQKVSEKILKWIREEK